MATVVLDERTVDELQAQAAASGLTVNAYVKLLLAAKIPGGGQGNQGQQGGNPSFHIKTQEEAAEAYLKKHGEWPQWDPKKRRS